MTTLRRQSLTTTLLGLTVLALTACTGGTTEGPTDDGATPEEVLGEAKTLLDETSGVELSLSTDDEPDTSAFLSSAEGVIVRDPAAFEGTASGTFAGFDAADIAVVSVDGDFQVELPVAGFQTFDPEDLCAPDPALLLDPDAGVSSVLTAATDLAEGGSERGGPDNAEVLTSFSGTVPGTAITNVLPCAPGDSFEATFTVNGDGYLRAADLTGEFFSGAGDLTYTIDLEAYDVEQEILAP